MADNHLLPDLLFSTETVCHYKRKRETVMASQKILRTEIGKVWRECGIFECKLAHFFMTKAKQDKIRCSFLTLMLYFTSIVNHAKVAT